MNLLVNLLVRRRATRVTLALLAACLTEPLVPSTASAQVVQLPAVHTFGTTGTVSVPDGGSALLGGNGYARSGSTGRGWGPVGSRASGSQVGGSTMSVHATIIDLDAMDQAILRAASGMPASSSSKAGEATVSAESAQAARAGRAIQSNFRSNTYGTQITNTLNPTRYSQQVLPRSSRAANDWQLAMAGASQITADNPTPGYSRDEDGAVRFYMQRAADAQNSGRIAAAKVYYRMAYDHMSPPQQERFNTLVEQRKADALDAIKKQSAGDSSKGNSATAASATAAASTSTAGGQVANEPAANEAAAASTASPFDMPAAAPAANDSPF